MRITHLTASTFFGGPERQMLGLADSLPGEFQSSFLLFREHGKYAAFADHLRERHHPVTALDCDTPKFRATFVELCDRLAEQKTDVIVSHGYKSNLLGRLAARKLGIPAVAVSRGWTGENWKVHLYETLDRWHLRYMDRVVCVSAGQAKKVRRARVPTSRLRVIPNAARLQAFAEPRAEIRETLFEYFPDAHTTDLLILAAGRLSPEKGFDVLIRAAELIVRQEPRARFLILGEGEKRGELETLVSQCGLTGRVALPGFRTDLDQLLPNVDLVVSSSFTEGLPNVLLEAASARRAIVATAVGGTPEVVADGVNGYLVPSGSPAALAEKILLMCREDGNRQRFGNAGRHRMEDNFSFAAQSAAYVRLFRELANGAAA